MSVNKNKLAIRIAAVSAAMALAGAADAMSWEVGDSTVDLYGYAKLDVLYDLDNYLGNAVVRSSIPVDGDAKKSESHFNIHAYQSRFGFRTSTPTSMGPFKTRIEVDFWGSPTKESSSQMLRLRHAYAEWNGILAGQTSSNFGPETSYMPTLDFYGQAGGPNGRVPQVRYTAGNFSVSIEDPEIAAGSVPTVDAGDDFKSSLPVVTAAYRGASEGLRYVVSATARKLDYYDASIEGEDSALAWGALVQAAYTVGGTTIRGGVSHGDGIGKQIYFNSGAPGYYDAASQKIETITATGIKVSVSQVVGSGSVNLGANRVINDADDEAAAMDAIKGMDEVQDSIFLNYIWSPIKRIRYGVEVAHHTRETFDDKEGSATRIQGSLQYFF